METWANEKRDFTAQTRSSLVFTRNIQTELLRPRVNSDALYRDYSVVYTIYLYNIN